MRSAEWLRLAPVAFLLAVVCGCAGTAPKAEFVQPIDAEHLIDAGDTTKANVTAAPDVEILEMEMTRIAQRIEERIDAKRMLNAPTDVPKAYRIELLLTRYEKGNAFARAMLAGLGQIHIDGTVSVYLDADETPISQFDIKKTFAWGGVYGGATGMEDIERTFADGIAEALTGRSKDDEDAAKKNAEVAAEAPKDEPVAGL